MAPEWLSPLIWWDFRLAVVTTVLMPLGLLAGAYLSRCQPLIQLMTYYWRVSSLLAITVYLMIAGFPLSFLTGALARALIPAALWFWDKLVDRILVLPGWIPPIFQVWRWMVTIYMGIGFFFSLAFLPCAFQSSVSASCRVWFEPPLAFRELFHSYLSIEVLGLVGLLGLAAYIWGAVIFGQLLRQGAFADTKTY